MEIITFNTGRGYSAEGQIITAVLVEDGAAYFNDESRGITGALSLNYFDVYDDFTPFALQEFVMAGYDKGRYQDMSRTEFKYLINTD